MKLYALILLFALMDYGLADCYPGDSVFTAIIQELYHEVTSDRIELIGSGHSSGTIDRSQLCQILTNHHNTGMNPGMTKTNHNFLGSSVSLSDCVNALTYTRGYDTTSGWNLWAGHHTGTWYALNRKFDDDAVWHSPTTKSDHKHTYALQAVKFNSKDRKMNCVNELPGGDGATCRDGWNQSGNNILYVWGWDPKDNNCRNGREGAHLGFTLSIPASGNDCIIWVTPEEAFLECIRNGKRTSTTSRDGSSSGYGQWSVSQSNGRITNYRTYYGRSHWWEKSDP